MEGSTPVVTRRQIVGVALGNALEFYDFLIFAFFAVQIGHAFFPDGGSGAGLLAALATFGAGFLTRPLGAVVLGIMGDRAGRRPAMILSFTLLGLSSLGLALVPSREAIGVAAPVIVVALRLVQGFALGGEVGSSTAFLVEAAPPGRAGRMIALQYVGQGAATLTAGLVGTALSAMLGEAALAAWGWRVAVALGVVVLPIGLYLRGALPETLARHDDAPAPRLRGYAGLLVIALLTMLSATIATYVLNYMTTYAATTLRLGTTVAFGATIAVGLGNALGALAGGALADRFGRRVVMIVPAAVASAATMPAFLWLVARPGAAALWSVSFGLRFVAGLAFTASLVFVAERLPARVRSGAIAIVYALAISIFGGSTQFVVAWLIRETGDPLAPAWYMLAALVIGLVASLIARERPARL